MYWFYSRNKGSKTAIIHKQCENFPKMSNQYLGKQQIKNGGYDNTEEKQQKYSSNV